MCFYYDGYCEVYDETVRKARKPHRCCSCHREIAPGDQYLYVFSVYEGEPSTRKVCNLCVQDARAIEQHERALGCSGIEAVPPWENVARLIRRGNPDEGWESEFPGDDKRGYGHVLTWPYGVPPAARHVDLTAKERA